MPDVNNYQEEDEWMAACVPAMIDEGRGQDQAVAACLSMWREKAAPDAGVDKADTHRNAAKRALRELLTLLENKDIPATLRKELQEAADTLKRTWGDLAAEAQEVTQQAQASIESGALELPMLMTKAERMADGRVRWQARANTGKKDLEGERFDVTFWDDVLHNFSRVQEATTKGEDVGLPVPILDIAHYSFRLPTERRNLARAGYPIKLWVDGAALMAQGYFDDTPLGRAAAKAATARPVTERRVSVGVWPDWGRVELDDAGHRIYKGGRGRAYLDHLAITAHPVDPGTILEVKSMTQKQDALDVLGADAEALVDELEEATTKAMPEGVVAKTEPAEKAETEAKEPEGKTPGDRSITLAELRELFGKFLETFKSTLDERMAPIEAAVQEIAPIKTQIAALSASETEKVSAAVDSGGDWLTTMIRRSVQRQEPVKEGPKATQPDSDFARMFGNPKK